MARGWLRDTTTIDRTPPSGACPRRRLRVAGMSSGRLRLPPPSPATPPQSTQIPHKDRANHGGNVKMPGLNDMEALAEAASYPPVVFVTAYSEYAVRAFELAAHDYLLKPLFADRLAKCLERVRASLVRRLSPAEMKALLPPQARFPVKAGGGEVFMDLDSITHFELQDDHVIACRGQNRYTTRFTTLTEVEQAFPEEGLMRIQRHLLVRPRAVIGTRPEGIGKMKIRVAQGVELSVSRTMTPRLRDVLRGTGPSS